MCRKSFPFEKHDEWLFGGDGAWSGDASRRRPDVLVVQVGER